MLQSFKTIGLWVFKILGVIALIHSIYVIGKGDRRRIPTFIVDPIVTNIIDRDSFEGLPLKLYDSKTDKEIKTNVSSVRFYFFNQGDEPIKPEHILKPLRILVQPMNRIIDYKILTVSRDVVRLKTGELGKGTWQLMDGGHVDSISNIIDIDFKVFEKNDGFSGQILFEGHKEAYLSMIGVVEGVDSISTEYNAKKIPNSLILVTFILSVTIFLLVEILLKFKTKLVFDWLNQRRSDFRSASFFFLIVAVSGFFFNNFFTQQDMKVPAEIFNYELRDGKFHFDIKIEEVDEDK